MEDLLNQWFKLGDFRKKGGGVSKIVIIYEKRNNNVQFKFSSVFLVVSLYSGRRSSLIESLRTIHRIEQSGFEP